MRSPCRNVLLLLATLILPVACNSKDDAALAARSRRVFGTLSDAASDRPADRHELVVLGRALYFSTDLSKNGTQSCNSCHPVDQGRPGADLLPTSVGALGPHGRRNTPTVFNADLHFAQFWDGRAATLEEQAKGPILNPVEMAMPDHAVVSERLRHSRSIPATMFNAAFPNEKEPYTIDHVARAIAAFERTLRTRDRFDDFQSGKTAALTTQEKQGLQLFMANGCTSCHNGPLLGANKYQKIGIVNAYDNTADRGRAEVTSNPADTMVFKVPSLRNVALTGPYFHDGRVETLQAAVDRMAWHQLGVKLEPAERDAIVAFLRTLSDQKQNSAD